MQSIARLLSYGAVEAVYCILTRDMIVQGVASVPYSGEEVFVREYEILYV